MAARYTCRNCGRNIHLSGGEYVDDDGNGSCPHGPRRGQPHEPKR